MAKLADAGVTSGCIADMRCFAVGLYVPRDHYLALDKLHQEYHRATAQSPNLVQRSGRSLLFFGKETRLGHPSPHMFYPDVEHIDGETILPYTGYAKASRHCAGTICGSLARLRR